MDETPTTYDELWSRLSWWQRFRIHLAHDYERLGWQAKLNAECVRADNAEAERDALREEVKAQKQGWADSAKTYESLLHELRDENARLRQKTPTMADDLLARADWLLDSTVEERIDAGVHAEDIVADLAAEVRALTARLDATPVLTAEAKAVINAAVSWRGFNLRGHGSRESLADVVDAYVAAVCSTQNDTDDTDQ